MAKASVTLTATPPYNFDLTAAAATHFRGQYGAERFQNGVFQRLLDVDGILCLLSVHSEGTLDEPRLAVALTAGFLNEGTIAEACRRVSWILGTEQDLAPFYHTALKEPKLAVIIKELWGLHIPRTASVYEDLVAAIIGQQVNSHVARLLWDRLVQSFGPSLLEADVVYHTFPRPEIIVAAGREGLRSIGLSNRKAEYILEISRRVASGELDLESLHAQTDEAIIRILSSLRGVGLWTAQWLLIHALGRSDGFPSTDLALQRALAVIKGGSPLHPDEAWQYSCRWSPFRSYVTTYLFAALRSGRLLALFPDGK